MKSQRTSPAKAGSGFLAFRIFVQEGSFLKRRVVVTGIGMVTPLGLDTETSWTGLVNGKSGIGPITQFVDKSIPTQIAGEVRGFDPEKYIEV